MCLSANPFFTLSGIKSFYAVLLIVVTAIGFTPCRLLSQTPHTDSASLQGVIRDSEKKPIVGVIVYLRSKNGNGAFSETSDSEGRYQFSALRDGIYTLHAEKANFGSITFDAISITAGEKKTLDLMLIPQDPVHSTTSAAEFFDQPQFTVAGVTDPTTAGGHGSQAVVRNTEALAKATAALSEESSTNASSLSSASEDAAREAVESAPEDFNANYHLGKLLADRGKTDEAIVYLTHAHRLNPKDYENAYELSLVYTNKAEYPNARAILQQLLTSEGRSHQDQAALHHLSGVIAEKSGDSLNAAREYQQAAELDPSETNLFDWGSELLEHRALEPAIEVFSKGKDSFPHSIRMLIGLGVAEYARGSNHDAIDRLCQAADVDPMNPAPYIFLGKIQSVEQIWSSPIAERLKRFATLVPGNALSNYYYATSLSRKMEESGEIKDSTQARTLLEKAIQLDPKLAPAYLQLGIVFAQQDQFPQAISFYQQAIEIDPQSAEEHYRLAQAYRKIGDTKHAAAEIQRYQQTSKETASEAERERQEIKEFVFTLRDSSTSAKPQ
jgi:tetratricopeptide (TPR) repeat protein